MSPNESGDPVFRFKPKQPVVWYHRLPDRSNKHCVFCGEDVSDSAVPSEEEHLIGRRFVPVGSFDGGRAFNFISRACKVCNGRKGSLERHLSTTTLFDSPAREASQEIDDLARRKASIDYHPHESGTLVQDAFAEFSFTVAQPGMKMTVDLSGPPPFDQPSVVELAYMHVQGFFSLMTSVDPTTSEGTRVLPQSNFYFGGAYGFRDWGNPRMLEVVRRVQSWDRFGLVTTASGYFQAEFRRNEAVGGPWFWALEWNKSLRLIGMIKLPTEVAAPFDDLPPKAGILVGDEWRMRFEVPLSAREDDLLFRWSDN